MEDSWRRAEESAKDIRSCLEPYTGGADPHREYAILKLRYQHASTRVPNHSWTDTEKVRGEFQTLYQRKEAHPPALTLETHINPVKVNNKIPSEAEVEASVRRLHPHRAGGHAHICMEYFKQC